MTSPASGEVLRVGSHGAASYAPQLVADALGFFRDEGLAVEFVPVRGGLGLLAALKAGEVDMFAGNPWFAMRYAEHDLQLRLVAQMCRYTRYVLVSPQGVDVPLEEMLVGRRRRTIVPSETPPVAWAALVAALRGRSIALSGEGILLGFTQSEAIEHLLGGGAEAVLLGVESAQDDRLGVSLDIGPAIGAVAWSVYCAPAALVAGRGDDLVAFRAGLARGQQWVRTHSVDEIVDAVSPFLPRMRRPALHGSVARFAAMGTWNPGPQVVLSELERWRDLLVRGGLLSDPVPVAGLAAFDVAP